MWSLPHNPMEGIHILVSTKPDNHSQDTEWRKIGCLQQARRASEYSKLNALLRPRDHRTSPRKHTSIYIVVDSFLSMLTLRS